MITRELEASFAVAVREARRRRHEMVVLEHVLRAFLDDDLASEILRGCGADLDALRKGLDQYLESIEPLPQGKKVSFSQSVAVTRVLQRAALHVQSAGKKEIDAGDVLAAMFLEKDSHGVWLLRKQGISRLDLLNFLSHGVGKGEELVRRNEDDDDATGHDEDDDDEGSSARGPRQPPADPLAAYTTPLVARAKDGKIDPLVGRAEELERTIHVLCRRRKNNPVYVGEPGVGKTAIAEGLALAIAEGKVPGLLSDAEIFALDVGALIAGTRFRGDFEQRLKAVLAAVRKHPKAILFIDEIHTIVGAGQVSGGTLDASNLLKPALASGELRCIGSTTYKDFQSAFEKDRAFARRFQKIEVKEPTVEETVKILEGLLPAYQSFHGVVYTHEAVRLAAELSAKYVNDRFLPDKAIDVLDETGAAERLAASAEPPLAEGETRPPRVVGAEQVEKIVAKIARIPPRTVSRTDKERLETLERDLKLVIYGQDPAIVSLVSAIKLNRSGLGSAEHPVGSFLFTGPTGVGKTELARQLARALGIELLRFDMSEYMEKHTVSRLIGAPPGYVGFDQGGLLTDAILKHPHAVLVLDEIEKAHGDIFNILLQVMDHATLTDNNGRKADFRNVVLVMTSNVGARELSGSNVGFGGGVTVDRKTDEKKAVEQMFGPEFRNRLDAWISFAHLAEPVIERVVDKFVAELEEALRGKKVSIELTDGARKWLAKHGYDRANGARPMGRLIEKTIRRPLADELLFGKLQSGGTVHVEEKGGELVLHVEAATAEESGADSTADAGETVH